MLQRLASQETLVERPPERGLERAPAQGDGVIGTPARSQSFIAARSTGGLTVAGARRAIGSAVSRRATCR